MISYVFWHRAREGVTTQAYERAAERFHRSLRHAPPAGFRRSALVRIGSAPWLDGEGWYEDWHLLDDFASLGVLNEAAVSTGHLSAHEQVASRCGEGLGALYRLIEGCESLAFPLATWVSVPPGTGAGALTLADMLVDGMDREHASLWRRQLALGPGPEHCLLSDTQAPGAAAKRLPHGWETSVLRREVLFDG